METLPPTPEVRAAEQGEPSHAIDVQTVLGASGQRRRRRTRRRQTKLRRIAGAFEPLGFVLALCILSMGVVKVVERGVPTKAAFDDSQRAEEERETMRSEVRELAETLDTGWAPSFQEGDEEFFLEDFTEFGSGGDPFAEIDAAQLAGGAQVPAEADL